MGTPIDLREHTVANHVWIDVPLVRNIEVFDSFEFGASGNIEMNLGGKLLVGVFLFNAVRKRW